jgi:hypothetical protein
MEKLVTCISRAALMGLAWAGAWVPIGVIAGPLFVGELEPEHIGGPLYTGLVCGTVFSALAGIASGRRLGDLSAYRAAAWGAASGLFTGMLPFVLGEGHATDYEAAWSTAIVATSSIAAGIAASRRWLGALSPSRAAILAAVVSGVPAGGGLWILTSSSQNGLERFLPLFLTGGLTGLGALTGFLSPSIARWLRKQNSPSPTSVTAGG